MIILLLTNVNANACMNGQIQRDLADICKGTIWIYWGWLTVLLFEVSCRLVSVLLLAKLCRIMTLTPTTSHSMCNLKLNINQHSMWNQNQNWARLIQGSGLRGGPLHETTQASIIIIINLNVINVIIVINITVMVIMMVKLIMRRRGWVLFWQFVTGWRVGTPMGRRQRSMRRWKYDDEMNMIWWWWYDE